MTRYFSRVLSTLPATIALSLLLCMSASADETRCRTVAGLRSVEAARESKFELVNRSRSPVRLKWIDPGHSPHDFGQVAPGETKGLTTFLTHVWTAVDPSGNCLDAFVSRGSKETWDVGNLAGADQERCKVVPSLRSADSASPMKLTLVNLRRAPVHIQWIDYSGAAKDFGDLPAGERRTLDTFATHVWVARENAGNCVSAHVATNNQETWDIGTLDARAEYDRLTVAGWQVWLSSTLKKTPAAAQNLKVLSDGLTMMMQRVPPAAVNKIRHVQVWLELEDRENPGGVYRVNPPMKAKDRNVQFTKNLADWINDQPMMVLHEFAHAYHDQVLSYENPEIKAAYERARASGRYDNVERYRGSGQRERAYAMTDVAEFFAELSEAYFGINDYFPFDRSDLQRFDPKSFEMIEKMWHRP